MERADSSDAADGNGSGDCLAGLLLPSNSPAEDEEEAEGERWSDACLRERLCLSSSCRLCFLWRLCRSLLSPCRWRECLRLCGLCERLRLCGFLSPLRSCRPVRLSLWRSLRSLLLLRLRFRLPTSFPSLIAAAIDANRCASTAQPTTIGVGRPHYTAVPQYRSTRGQSSGVTQHELEPVSRCWRQCSSWQVAGTVSGTDSSHAVPTS